MNIDRYMTLRPGRLDEFIWEQTDEKKIIVRDKITEEIFAVIDRPLSVREAIADGYNQGLITGHGVSQRYIDFLEDLKAPFMPENDPTMGEYTPPIIADHPAENQYETYQTTDGAKGYVIEICIPDDVAKAVDKLSDVAGFRHNETFYSTIAEEYLGNEDSKSAPVLAEPIAGRNIEVYISDAVFNDYEAFSLGRGYTIASLLVTAITNITLHMTKNIADETNEVAEPKPNNGIDQAPLHCFGSSLEAAE